MRLRCWVLFAALCGGTSGCRFARSLIDTQPVVAHGKEDFTRPADIVGGAAWVYQPAFEDPQPVDGMGLLARYAPRIVQGVLPPGADDYDPDSDRLGRPRLRTAEDGYTVHIDTGIPQVYGRLETETAGDRELTQLVYVFWYPRRPVGVVQQGDVDGGVLRVTLDAAGRKAIYEYAQTCGCLHGVFVSEHLEAWAAREFPALDPGKSRWTERQVEGKPNWVVRDVVYGADAAARPVVFVKAGNHECVAIQTSETVALPESIPGCDYSLRPYEELAALPVDDRPAARASMFDASGLVWGGCRGREELVFSDLDHPGWPRHLDRMRISWDESHWNDPHLLETFLRLPRQMRDPGAADLRLDAAIAPTTAEPQPLAAPIRTALSSGRPVAVLFTHDLCAGCQLLEREVLERSEVHEALAPWTLLAARLQEPEGQDLASRYRVDRTPTLMVLDDQGREIRRLEGVSTAPEFVALLQVP